MVRFFAGLALIALGLAVAGRSFYYAWASGTPNIAENVYSQYQTYSLIFGLISLGIIIFGVALIILSVKKSNREYVKSQHDLTPEKNPDADR
jgi:hypothetical protein